ncbi:hypothetical protein F66182_343 [Fusarium sp. NRRL 66182]|nr:hypothetical protein F66182_343 [Fusarium sp. NRRL 66182]
MPRPTLSTLPVEILNAICTQLCSHCKDAEQNESVQRGSTSYRFPSLVGTSQDPVETRALINLARTCQALYHIVTQFAYHDLHVGSCRTPRLIKFAQSSLARPVLRQHVRRLYIEANVFPPGPNWLHIEQWTRRLGMCRDHPHLHFWDPPIDKEEFDFDDVGSFDGSDDDDSAEYPKRLQESHAVLVDVFLTLFSNVSRLALDLTPGAIHGDFLPALTTLDSLRHLTLCAYTQVHELTGPYNMRGLEHLLKKAANLDTLEIKAPVISAHPLSLGNLKSLKLFDSLLSLEDLKNLCRQCLRLEVFTYTYSIAPSIYDIGKDFRLEELPQTLVSLKGTLRCLAVFWQPKTPFSVDHYISSFKDFTALTALVLGGKSLHLCESPMDSSLVRLLPPSIETVTLDGQHLGVYEPIFTLAKEAKAGSFPSLKTLRQTGFEPDSSSNPVKTLKETMEDSGISFETCPTSVFA